MQSSKAIRVINCRLPYPGVSDVALVAHPRYAVHGLMFLPQSDEQCVPSLLVATHGLTASKADLITWPWRLVEAGVASIIFGLPGHYLDGWSEVPSFDWFKDSAHHLFASAYHRLREECLRAFPQVKGQWQSEPPRAILAGHSLGGLLALKALELEDFIAHGKCAGLAVGLGLPRAGATHLFNTPFYQKTFHQRTQLISPVLEAQKILAWIGKQKANLRLRGQHICLLAGKDDIVVGPEGVERMAELLRGQSNQVDIQRVAKLPHHAPELAAPHIKSWINQQGFLGP